ncbi:MAG: MFS transporter [Candidatus Brocadiae bacterium]|nr:MFS transporter [Candidatus Brocadiia bacterium]
MSREPGGERGIFSSVPSEYRRRGYRHTASWVFYGACFSIAVGQGPFVIRQLGGSALQCLLVNYGLGLPLLFALVWVPFLEKRNPVRLTGLLLGLGGLLVVFSALARSTWSLALVLAGGMALSAISQPALGTALAQIYPTRWRGKLLALPNTAAMLARVLCLVLVGRLLRQDIGLFRWVFPAAGVSLIVSGALFRGVRGSRGVRSDAEGQTRFSASAQVMAALRATFRNRLLLVFLIGYFITTCGAVAYANVLPLFARDQLGLTTAQWGYARAGFMAAMLVSFTFWGIFLDRFGAALTVVLAWTLQCAVFVPMFFVKSWPLFFFLVAARGLFQAGNMLAFFPMVMHFTDSSETARGMALHFSLWGLRWILMASAVVCIVDRGLFPMRYVFLFTVVLVVVGLVIMVWVWWRDCAARSASAV